MTERWSCHEVGCEALCPLVGHFVRVYHVRGEGLCDAAMSELCVGEIRQLGRCILLTVKPRHGFVFSLDSLPDGTWLSVGDRLGEFRPICGQTEAAEGAVHGGDIRIFAPISGFFVSTDALNRPFAISGACILPGSVLGYIELMKLRLEVTFDREVPARFEGYEVQSASAIEAGCLICRLSH